MDACDGKDALMISVFLQEVFDFLQSSSLPFAVLRSYESLPEEVSSGDIDILIKKEDGLQLIRYLRTRNYKITSVGRHTGAIHLFIFLSSTEQIQIDLMYEAEYNGIPYLDVSELLSSSIPYKSFYILAPWHEYFFLLLPHFFYEGVEKEKYKDRLHELRSIHGDKIAELHKKIFGHPTRPSLGGFLWNHRYSLPSAARYYSWEVQKYIRQPFCRTVSFLGPDGAGKSTVLERLTARNIQFTKSTSHTHLKPQHLLKKRSQSRGLVTEPHAEEPRSSWSASLKLGVYVQEYWIEHFMNPKRNSHLKIYDRYVHDTMIDARRYRLSEDNKISSLVTRFAPQPVLFLILDADPNVIQSRKAEVSLEATQKQCASYLNFAKRYPARCAIIDANQEVEKVVDDIVVAISERLAKETDEQLQDMFGLSSIE